jgi:hypothetical protein
MLGGVAGRVIIGRGGAPVFLGEGVFSPGSWNIAWSSKTRTIGAGPAREVVLPLRPLPDNKLPRLPPPPPFVWLFADSVSAGVVAVEPFLDGLNASRSLPTGEGLRR